MSTEALIAANSEVSAAVADTSTGQAGEAPEDPTEAPDLVFEHAVKALAAYLPIQARVLRDGLNGREAARRLRGCRPLVLGMYASKASGRALARSPPPLSRLFTSYTFRCDPNKSDKRIRK